MIVIPVTIGEYFEDVDLASLVLYVSTSDSKINEIIVFPFGTESLDWNLEVKVNFFKVKVRFIFTFEINGTSDGPSNRPSARRGDSKGTETWVNFELTYVNRM